MPVLPIPMINALLLLGLLLRRMLTRKTHPSLLILIGCCAVQSATIALVQYYGITGLRVFQAIFATVIPVVAWLAFRQASVGRLRKKELCLHAAGPAVALISLAIRPEFLGALIPIVFATYGFAIAVALLKGEDSLPHSRLENGGISVLVWRVLAIALVVSAASDVVIEIHLASGNSTVLLWLPSLFFSLTLLVLGALSLSHAIESQEPSLDSPTEYSAQDKERDTETLNKLETYIETQKPYLDPDLTLARLGRKLRVPEKQLSRAINKGKGENVSRYINTHRVHHACAMMQSGTSVTEAMLASGFNTKSNFNREFLRVMETNPRLWLKSIAEFPD